MRAKEEIGTTPCWLMSLDLMFRCVYQSVMLLIEDNELLKMVKMVKCYVLLFNQQDVNVGLKLLTLIGTDLLVTTE